MIERPKASDEPVVQFAAHKLAEQICEEWDHNGDIEQWAESLAKEMRFYRGGYELARELERYHFVTPDRQLVELLDEASWMLGEAHEDALKKWVKITGWEPRFAVGDVVTCEPFGRGFINGVQADKGTYYFVPDTERDSGKYRQGGGYVIADDRLTASGIETEGQDHEDGLGAKHESPAPKADAQ